MCSVALLSYAVARTWWTLDDVFIYPHGVPFPILPDLFFVLQYPFFFLGLMLIPHTRSWGPRVIMILDGLLLMGGASALSWYFILEPIFTQSGLAPLARAVILVYPVGDLFLLFGLTTILLRPFRHEADRPVVSVLVVAVACLILADVWVNQLILHPAHVYRTGQVPDLFWIAFYVLVPLAAVVQLRLSQRDLLRNGDLATTQPKRRRLEWDDLKASLRFFFPIVVALLASVVITIHATMTVAGAGRRGLIPPLVVSVGLLLLVLARQEITFLEQARMRRAREAARANELALRELVRRKDEFLSILSHELRTPLTSLQGYMELMARRLNTRRPHKQEEHGERGEQEEEGAERRERDIAMARTLLASSEASLQRITRLADDLVDDARIRDGRLILRLAPCELGAIVRAAAEEQRALEPHRTIRLELPAAQSAPLIADADRLGQVVTNYLTNALKYSKEDQPVEVRLEVEQGVAGESNRARVSVRDEGPGLTLADQAHVFERFPQIEGTAVQSGSGVSLGLGLYISRRIIEEHQGAVGVHSAPGQGATFFFTLPLAHSPS